MTKKYQFSHQDILKYARLSGDSNGYDTNNDSFLKDAERSYYVINNEKTGIQLCIPGYKLLGYESLSECQLAKTQDKEKFKFNSLKHAREYLERFGFKSDQAGLITKHGQSNLASIPSFNMNFNDGFKYQEEHKFFEDGVRSINVDVDGNAHLYTNVKYKKQNGKDNETASAIQKIDLAKVKDGDMSTAAQYLYDLGSGTQFKQNTTVSHMHLQTYPVIANEFNKVITPKIKSQIIANKIANDLITKITGNKSIQEKELLQAANKSFKDLNGSELKGVKFDEAIKQFKKDKDVSHIQDVVDQHFGTASLHDKYYYKLSQKQADVVVNNAQKSQQQKQVQKPDKTAEDKELEFVLNNYNRIISVKKDGKESSFRLQDAYHKDGNPLRSLEENPQTVLKNIKALLKEKCGLDATQIENIINNPPDPLTNLSLSMDTFGTVLNEVSKTNPIVNNFPKGTIEYNPPEPKDQKWNIIVDQDGARLTVNTKYADIDMNTGKYGNKNITLVQTIDVKKPKDVQYTYQTDLKLSDAKYKEVYQSLVPQDDKSLREEFNKNIVNIVPATVAYTEVQHTTEDLKKKYLQYKFEQAEIERIKNEENLLKQKQKENDERLRNLMDAKAKEANKDNSSILSQQDIQDSLRIMQNNLQMQNRTQDAISQIKQEKVVQQQNVETVQKEPEVKNVQKIQQKDVQTNKTMEQLKNQSSDTSKVDLTKTNQTVNKIQQQKETQKQEKIEIPEKNQQTTEYQLRYTPLVKQANEEAEKEFLNSLYNIVKTNVSNKKSTTEIATLLRSAVGIHFKGTSKSNTIKDKEWKDLAKQCIYTYKHGKEEDKTKGVMNVLKNWLYKHILGKERITKLSKELEEVKTKLNKILKENSQKTLAKSNIKSNKIKKDQQQK